MNSSVWSKEKIRASIKALDADGVYLGGGAIREEYPSLYGSARSVFGSWRKALESCGVDYELKATHNWTKGRIIAEIGRLSLAGKDISPETIGKSASGLYSAAKREFGSWNSALEQAGVASEEPEWDRNRVLEAVRELQDASEPLNYKHAYYRHPKLLRAAEKFLGSWKKTLEACGLDYESIRKDKGRPEYTGQDGKQYASNLNMLVADELFAMKLSRKIRGYAGDVRITYKRWWSCDFIVYLNNNTEVWVEVDGLGQSRKPPYDEDHPKIRHYIECGLLWEVVTAPDQIADIIEKRTKLYAIPLRKSVITAHAHPDADAVSSCVAVHRHLAEHGVPSSIRLEGDMPSNLADMVPPEASFKKMPEDAEQIIVLDSGWEKERIGWEVGDLPILNIDHHATRIKKHDPENGVFVIDMCSTAGILVRCFGIRDDILIAGIYGDTLFRRRMSEMAQLLTTLDVEDSIAQETVWVVDQINSGIVLSAMQSARTSRCRNGFMIVRISEPVPSWAITDIMSIMSRMSESVCLISPGGEVRLRTSNQRLDVSEIAKAMGGGGHPFAAGCAIRGKHGKLVRLIRAARPKEKKSEDGYG